MTRHIITILIVIFFASPLSAQVVFHNEKADTTRINNILIEVLAKKHTSAGASVIDFAESFIGTPYVAGTLEGDPEVLRVDIEGMDCTTFVETMMALAMTVNENRSSWRDFTYNLQNIRYRNGQVNGYPSRLHYIADWAVNNSFRGNFKDVTDLFPRVNYAVKSLNFMSANADKYPALADSANLEGIKSVEIGYRGHRYPFIKSGDLSAKDTKAEFRDGDIVALTSNLKNLDVTHMGIIKIKDGQPYLIHASSSAGKVVITDVPFDQYMKRNRQFTGARVFRLQQH